MKFMIAVDLEGVAGVVGAPHKGLNDTPDYPRACLQAAREANAAARALFDAGARQVVVWDNHGGGVNLPLEELDSRCDILMGLGAPHGRWPGLTDEFTAVLMVGYHAMDNTADGVMAHTYSSSYLQWVRVNGQEWGEIAVDAAMAGDRDVPVLFVSSDEAGVREAGRFLPWAAAYATKTGYGGHLALCKHPRAVLDGIYASVTDAMGQLARIRPFHAPRPVIVEQRFKRMEDALSAANEGNERLDGYTIRRSLEKLSDWI